MILIHYKFACSYGLALKHQAPYWPEKHLKDNSISDLIKRKRKMRLICVISVAYVVCNICAIKRVTGKGSVQFINIWWKGHCLMNTLFWKKLVTNCRILPLLVLILKLPFSSVNVSFSWKNWCLNAFCILKRALL